MRELKLSKPIIAMIPSGAKSIETGFHEINAAMEAKPDPIWLAATADEENPDLSN